MTGHKPRAAVSRGVADICIAANCVACASGCRRPQPGTACPVATQGDVQDDLLGLGDVRTGVAVQGHVGQHPPTPGLRLGGIGRKICRNLCIRNVVDGDTISIPGRSHDARVLCEPLSRTLNLSWPATKEVFEVVGVAVGWAWAASWLAAHALPQFPLVQETVPVGVEGDLAHLIIGILQDVKLPTIWPEHVTVHEPEGWPDPSAVRNMVVLHHHKHAVIW
mmetsp:Transcript_91883/g.165897  ORF Transcript_91883/g.165897 Transcript_91883/m.165897 type:complete len:221 (+) Transcript_91883:239-901(+)